MINKIGEKSEALCF